MRRILKFSLLLPMAVALLFFTPARADAITLQEIIDMTRAGISDDVLLALIDVDRSVYPVDPATLTKLKQSGVSETVMVAIVKSGRTPAPELPPPPVAAVPQDPPEPQIVYVERERPVVREIHEVVVPVPVYYVAVGSPYGRHINRGVSADVVISPDQLPRSLSNPFGVITPLQQPQPKRAEPVYWGWGGKLRPDAWQPAPAPRGPRDR
jgi:hypothetical protein